MKSFLLLVSVPPSIMCYVCPLPLLNLRVVIVYQPRLEGISLGPALCPVIRLVSEHGTTARIKTARR